jgi:hypothetical protein
VASIGLVKSILGSSGLPILRRDIAVGGRHAAVLRPHVAIKTLPDAYR